MSERERLILVNDINSDPVVINKMFNNNSRTIFLCNRFNYGYHFIKSFTAVYIAAKTPRRERIIVNTGFWKPKTLSSFIPPQVVKSIIPTIWNAIPEYLPKSRRPLFPELFRLDFFGDCCSSMIIIITHFAIP